MRNITFFIHVASFCLHKCVSCTHGLVGFVQESLAHNDSSNPSICFPGIGGNNMNIYIFFISLRYFFQPACCGFVRSFLPSLLTQHLEIGALGGFSRKHQFSSLSLKVLISAVKTRFVVFLLPWHWELYTYSWTIYHSLTRTLTKTFTQTIPRPWVKSWPTKVLKLWCQGSFALLKCFSYADNVDIEGSQKWKSNFIHFHRPLICRIKVVTRLWMRRGWRRSWTWLFQLSSSPSLAALSHWKEQLHNLHTISLLSWTKHLNWVAMTTRQRLIMKKEPMTMSMTK